MMGIDDNGGSVIGDSLELRAASSYVQKIFAVRRLATFSKFQQWVVLTAVKRAYITVAPVATVTFLNFMCR
jgi:hypothetical protein